MYEKSPVELDRFGDFFLLCLYSSGQGLYKMKFFP